MSIGEWFAEQSSKIASAGLETLEAVGEGAVSGITEKIQDFGGRMSGANPDAQRNNAPDLGPRGDGRGTVIEQPVATQYRAPGFVQGMPIWAKWLAGGSVALLAVGVTVKLVKG